MKKRCTKCGIKKSLNKFSKDKSTKDGLQCCCKECRKKYNQMRKTKTAKYRKEYYQTHKVESAEQSKRFDRSEKGKLLKRKHLLKRGYGLTLEQYDEMIKEQDSICAICGSINSDGRRLCVDHNHETGKIRKLLCHCCNSLVGYAKEDIIILRSTINYLENHKT